MTPFPKIIFNCYVNQSFVLLTTRRDSRQATHQLESFLGLEGAVHDFVFGQVIIP
jgi:hypothetical protein